MRKFSNKKLAFVALCIALLMGGTATAWAQDSTSQMAINYDDQLALDVTPVPPGSGAIFVPSLSNPKNESRVVVYYQGQKITSGNTGERLVVPPGQYQVVIGTGNKDLAARSTARVVDGATIVLQPFYGGVKLVAVDTSGNPIHVNYTIKEGGATLVNGSTPGEKDAQDEARAYLLPPGPKTWQFSDGTQIAFDVPQGDYVAYRAIFSGDHFVGLDHVTNNEKPVSAGTPSMWRTRLTIGADVSGAYATKQLSDYNGIYGQLGAFVNAEVGIDKWNNLFTFKLNLDESWVWVKSDYANSVPLRAMRDRVSFELLYAYRLARIFGPFVRATADTSLFGNKLQISTADEKNITCDGSTCPTDMIRATNTDPSVVNYKLLNYFNPLFLEEAAGFNLTAIDNSTFDLVLLAGVAARQHFFKFSDSKHAYFIDSKGSTVKKGGSSPQDAKIQLVSLNNNTKLYGALAEARLGLRLSQTFRISAVGKMFVPYQQIPGIYKLSKDTKTREKFAPLYSVSAIADLSLNNWASFVLRGEYSLPDNQLKEPSIYAGGAIRVHANIF